MRRYISLSLSPTGCFPVVSLWFLSNKPLRVSDPEKEPPPPRGFVNWKGGACVKRDQFDSSFADGPGKSTVMCLIQRFYDPQTGKILIGSQQKSLDSLNIRWWRKQIGPYGCMKGGCGFRFTIFVALFGNAMVNLKGYMHLLPSRRQ